MDIKELITKKTNLQQEIAEKLNAFEEETGVTVGNILLHDVFIQQRSKYSKAVEIQIII